MYRLLRAADGALVLEVVAGGIALYTVRVVLSDEEAAAYGRQGLRFLDPLAQRIQADPSFGGRATRVP